MRIKFLLFVALCLFSQHPEIEELKNQLQKNEGDIWECKLRLGDCYEKSGSWSEALYWYLETFQEIPSRTEPLLRIARYYRDKGENDLAYIFAKHGSRIFPTSNYRFEEELSIVSFYTRFKEDGYKAASDLLIRKDVPWHIKEGAYRNILFYTHNLKYQKLLPISIDFPFICEDCDERYHPMNPSIQKSNTGYKVICRTVNYQQKGAKEFDTVDPSGYFRTRNFLIDYDREFQMVSHREISDELDRYRVPSCNVLGLEDPRLFTFNQEYWFTCTNRDSYSDGVPRIALCKLGDEANVEKFITLQGPDPSRCEKNWLPFVMEGALHVIYSYDPFTVYKPNIFTGECPLEISYKPNHDFSHFRGSAGPIPFDNGYLVLVHEVVSMSDFSRVYLHRFVHLDNRLFIKQVSKPFTFLHHGVEYCTSMTLDYTGNQLILPIGIEDKEAYLCFVDVKTVRSLLEPLPSHL